VTRPDAKPDSNRLDPDFIMALLAGYSKRKLKKIFPEKCFRFRDKAKTRHLTMKTDRCPWW
jgi:hypothetical protein